MLLLSNIIRIFSLVVLDLLELQTVAEIAHTSMSATGFTVSIYTIWTLAQTQRKQPGASASADSTNTPLSFRQTCLPVSLLLIAVSAIPNTNSQVHFTHRPIVLPQALNAVEIALRREEARFFGISGALAAKYQLKADQHSTLVLVTSNWWKAQHKPDHCLQAMGLTIRNARTLTLPDRQTQHTTGAVKTVSMLSLLDADNNTYTAIYWFQSKDGFTAEHYQRMADSLFHPDRTWTMASMLLDGDRDVTVLDSLINPVIEAISTSYGDQS